jgi:hypothetical protein
LKLSVEMTEDPALQDLPKSWQTVTVSVPDPCQELLVTVGVVDPEFGTLDRVGLLDPDPDPDGFDPETGEFAPIFSAYIRFDCVVDFGMVGVAELLRGFPADVPLWLVRLDACLVRLAETGVGRAEAAPPFRALLLPDLFPIAPERRPAG